MNPGGASEGWLTSGVGDAPDLRWTFSTDAPLVDLAAARESGDVVAGDASGGIYRIDRRGRVVSVTRGFSSLSALALCDTGQAVAAVVRDTRLCRLDRRLDLTWSLDLPDTVLAIAVDPFGDYIAASLADGKTHIIDARKETVGRFQTNKALCLIALLATEPVLVGAAEYGLLCSYRLDGTPRWSESLLSSVGDLAATGDGSHLYLAGFSHGVLAFDGEGTNRGTYVLEGTPNRVSASFAPRRLCATTLERHMYWIDASGEMLWAGVLPEDAARIRCDPVGNGVVCGLVSGRIVSLRWG
jgi:hypothetical protein